MFLQRFFVVLALILPFEIRDLRFDSAQLGTIPQRFGIRRTKIIGGLLICVVVLLEFFNNQASIENMVSLIIIGILIIFLIWYSAVRQSKYYAAFWVEGVPIFWWLFLALLSEIT